MAEEPDPRDIQRLQALQKRLDDARETGKALTTERNELRKRLADTEKALTKAQAEADTNRSEGEQLRAALEEILVSLGVRPPARGGAPALIEALQKALAALRERLEAAEQRAAQLAAALKEAEARAAAAEQRVAEADKALEQLREQLARLEQQIKEQVRAAEQRAEQAETALAAAQATIKALEGGEATINELLAENRRLAEQLDAFSGDLGRLRTAADEASAAASAAHAAADAANTARAAVEKTLATTQAERARLQDQVTLLSGQISDAGQTPFLTADQVAGMLDGLVKQINLGGGGLVVRDGQVNLKVGFGAAGEHVGFVIPTPEQATSIKDGLHEVTLRFDRSLGDVAKASLTGPRP